MTALVTTESKRTARVFEMGEVEYDRARQLQLQLVDQRIAGTAPDTFIFTSHPPTITIGRSGGAANVLASGEELKRRSVTVFEVERGGDVTFHGPGQQIVYPVIDLNQRGRDLHRFLRDLENVVIDFLRHYGIAGSSIPGRTGVWVGDKKICAIGIAVRRWVTYHGLALNLDTDLSYFQLINPCGFDSHSVISLQELTGRPINRSEVFYQLLFSISTVFGYDLTF